VSARGHEKVPAVGQVAVHEQNYGARKVCLVLNGEGIAVARCTIERLKHWVAVQHR
jgi:hypothetical protein